jgi:hypothetical protein
MNRGGGLLTILAAAALGAAFFVWIAGVRVITPTEVAWTMQGDWRIHFLGWHVFRHEPWHLPLGRIDTYFQPLGTAVGFTDSIPAAAFVLKPFSALLPASFQYLGLWLLLCFVLQGVFAVFLMRLWTSSVAQQLLGAVCFILVPTLLARVGHPALCSHWLLLWALWLYLRADRLPRAPLAQSAVVALITGMVHPYLALMVMALLGALGLRLLLARRVSGIAIVAVGVCAMLTGWWLSGLFTVVGAENLMSEGLTKYSTNLLAPITPTGWSTFLPEIPIGAEGQLWEGFHYFGLGLLLLIAGAILARVAMSGERHTVTLWPLIIVVTLLAIYSLSPRVTFGSAVVAEINSPLIDRLAIFRATGRFFWPAAYLMLTMALAVVVSRVPARVATAILCAVIAVQVADLRGAYAFRRQTSRGDAFYAWRPSMASPAWARLLPNYAHIVVYPPTYCGPSPVDIESLTYMAGLHGLTLNSGLVARFDEMRRRAACREIADTLLRGEVDDSRIYLGRPGEIDLLKKFAKQPVVCGVIDAVGICATTRSYERWRDAAHLE